jgi:hypothetical protein
MFVVAGEPGPDIHQFDPKTQLQIGPDQIFTSPIDISMKAIVTTLPMTLIFQNRTNIMWGLNFKVQTVHTAIINITIHHDKNALNCNGNNAIG